MSRFRVMVVDDDPDVRFVITTLLASEFETVEAHNGLDALEKIDRYEPDLLVLDINMPIMSGIDCAEALRRNPTAAHLPFVFLTALSSSEVRERATATGAQDYIEKPFDSANVIARLAAIFEKNGATPREKAFTLGEIAVIDATPLEAVDCAETVGDIPADPRRDILHREEEPSRETKRVRRVFGRKSTPEVATPPAEEKPDRDTVDLPPPPEPDYQRATREAQQRQVIFGRQREDPAPELPKPPGREPSPKEKASPPAGATPDLRPKAPSPRAPSPAEILAQRRLGALGKTAAKHARPTQPRILVLIDRVEHLEIFHRALKGIAEFLPLEDPVHAVELIARFQPDVVVASIISPRYSGLQLAQLLRSNPRLSHIAMIFVQGPQADGQSLQSAERLTRVPILRLPLSEASISEAIQTLLRTPGFSIRDKNLGYGVYVKEVLRAADEARQKENKEREKEIYELNFGHLARFMAHELKDYKEPEGFDELKGIGHKFHEIEIRET